MRSRCQLTKAAESADVDVDVECMKCREIEKEMSKDGMSVEYDRQRKKSK